MRSDEPIPQLKLSLDARIEALRLGRRTFTAIGQLLYAFSLGELGALSVSEIQLLCNPSYILLVRAAVVRAQRIFTLSELATVRFHGVALSEIVALVLTQFPLR